MTAYKNTTSMFNLMVNKTLFNDFLSDGSGNDSDDTNSYLNKSIFYDKESPTTELYRFITYGILLNIIGVFGIVGNIITNIVLCRPQMRSSVNCILLALVRVDTILIITSIFLFGIPGIYPVSLLRFTYWYKFYVYLLLVVYPLATAVQTASVYLTVMVALDRFIAVCHPLRSRSWCTYGRARLNVILISIFSILYNIPRLWEVSISSKWDERFNTSILYASPSKIRQNNIYLKVYIHWCYFIFLYLIPLLSLGVLNLAVYIQMRKANQERARLSRLQRRKIGSATMLICVVFVFLVCNGLPTLLNILESFEIYIEPDIFDRMIMTSNLLVTINSSLNFIIYVIFGEKFKRLFLQLFCRHGLLGLSGRNASDAGTLGQNVIGMIRLNFMSVGVQHLRDPKDHRELTDTV